MYNAGKKLGYLSAVSVLMMSFGGIANAGLICGGENFQPVLYEANQYVTCKKIGCSNFGGRPGSAPAICNGSFRVTCFNATKWFSGVGNGSCSQNNFLTKNARIYSTYLVVY